MKVYNLGSFSLITIDFTYIQCSDCCHLFQVRDSNHTFPLGDIPWWCLVDSQWAVTFHPQ